MKNSLKNLHPSADELTSKDLKTVYGGKLAPQAVAGGDKGDSSYSSGVSEACCCACKC